MPNSRIDTDAIHPRRSYSYTLAIQQEKVGYNNYQHIKVGDQFMRLYPLLMITILVMMTVLGAPPLAASGQEGNLRADAVSPTPRFSVSGDCVTDNLTGLMWTKDGNLPDKRKYRNFTVIPAKKNRWGGLGDPYWPNNAIGVIPQRGSVGGNCTWLGAQYWVNSFNRVGGVCGYADWRLPTRKELKSLVNRQQPDNSIWLNSQGFSNVQWFGYWSSDSYNKDLAWIIWMKVGGENHNAKAALYNVWPVRLRQKD
jgi:hypothetical protein